MLRRYGQERRAFSGRMATAARAFLDGYENNDHEMATNGEMALLRRLAAVEPRMAFDVGANHGDWTAAALNTLPGVAVHAFEIAPPTYAKLAARFADDPACRTNSFGLGEAEATVPLDYYADNDLLTSRVQGIGLRKDSPCIIDGRLRAARAYCVEAGIANVDIVKIDVEGAEYQVLEGFGDMLSAGAVGLIQFEFGIANIASRTLLKDFYALLGPAGFEIGKLYPHGAAFAPYSPVMDDFRGPYFVAVHRSRPAMRAAAAAAA
jgi:FkbM family methyltransferase